MEIKIDVPEYSPESGLTCKWEKGFKLTSKIEYGVIYISANREGLISLANHLLNLAQEAVPAGHHLHLDENNSFETGSREVVFEKI